MRSLWRGASLALALSLSLFAAGCDDDNDDVTTPDTPAPQEPSPAPPPPAAPAPTPTTAPEPPAPVPGDEVVFLGRLKSIDLPTLHVGSRVVQVQEQTQFVRGPQGVSQNDLVVGQTLRVRGRLMNDRSSILADKIAIEQEP